MSPIATQDVTVLDLPYFSVAVSDATLGSEVARLLEQDRTLPGIIVMSEGKFRGLVPRNQFFQRLGRLFGIEVYFSRPITALNQGTTFTIKSPGPVEGSGGRRFPFESKLIWAKVELLVEEKPRRWLILKISDHETHSVC
jgi:hypothetical protein